jgi:hypothetical protein
MSDVHSHSEVKIGSDRTFGLLLAVVFAVFALLPLLRDGGVRLIPAVVAVALAGVALGAPWLLSPLNRLWFRLGMLMGAVVTPVVMTVVFVVAVVPTALVRRLAGHDDLRLAGDPSASTYWVTRDDDGDPRQTMSRQY